MQPPHATTTVQPTGRYEETAYHRHELEAVKRENEALKRKIRELERTLRARRASDASRTRSESVSTTASIREGGMAGGGVSISGNAGRGSGVAPLASEGEDVREVRFGESAMSAGLR